MEAITVGNSLDVGSRVRNKLVGAQKKYTDFVVLDNLFWGKHLHIRWVVLVAALPLLLPVLVRKAATQKALQVPEKGRQRLR